MSECSSGEISVSCAGGCGLICTSTHCYGWCEPIYLGEVDRTREPVQVAPSVVRVARETGQGTPTAPAGSDTVKLCAHDLSPDTLIAGLSSVLEVELEAAGASAARGKELPFSGTVDELLEHLELRRAGTSEGTYR